MIGSTKIGAMKIGAMKRSAPEGQPENSLAPPALGNSQKREQVPEGRLKGSCIPLTVCPSKSAALTTRKSVDLTWKSADLTTWKSGASAPRKANMNAGFSPRGRIYYPMSAFLVLAHILAFA